MSVKRQYGFIKCLRSGKVHILSVIDCLQFMNVLLHMTTVIKDVFCTSWYTSWLFNPSALFSPRGDLL